MGGGSANSLNDVWSFDGTTWTQHPDAPWAAQPIINSVSVFQNKIWFIDVNSGLPTLHNRGVWSFDGTIWTQHLDTSWVLMTQMPTDKPTFTLGNKLFAAGGGGGDGMTMTPGLVYNDLWSFDGSSWVQQANAPWLPRVGHSVTPITCTPPNPTASNTISGKVYNDQNANGAFTAGESGLSGIQVGLYPQGSSTPIQTATTTAFTPNTPLGSYTFSNVPNGVYNIALINESVYPSITEPIYNNPLLLAGHTHAKQVSVSGTQTIANKNFGVTLVTGTGGTGTPTVSVIDVCSNIPGTQITVPVGYSRIGNRCYKLIRRVPVTDPVVKAVEISKTLNLESTKK